MSDVAEGFLLLKTSKYYISFTIPELLNTPLYLGDFGESGSDDPAAYLKNTASRMNHPSLHLTDKSSWGN